MFYRFKGTNGSMGFITGKVYFLEKRYDRFPYIIAIYREKVIPYSSEKTFRQNWEEVGWTEWWKQIWKK